MSLINKVDWEETKQHYLAWWDFLDFIFFYKMFMIYNINH